GSSACWLAGVAWRVRSPAWPGVSARWRGLACPLAGVAPTCWPAGAGTAVGGGGFRIRGRCGPGFPASPPHAVENRNTARPRPANAELTPSAAAAQGSCGTTRGGDGSDLHQRPCDSDLRQRPATATCGSDLRQRPAAATCDSDL